MTSRPAALGGAPAFPDGLPFARPAAPPLDAVARRVEPSWSKGTLTNGPLVRELEERAAEHLGVSRVVAVSSCTAGLMLSLRALIGGGAVLLPSFTFSASAHAVVWNGAVPLFVECDRRSLQVDVTDAGRRANAGDVSAVMATHVFGAPCDAEAMEALGRRLGVPVLFDAAHGFGARRGQRRVGGLGDVEVFSMSPTKVLVAGEGGLVATDNDALADQIVLGRDYGNPGDYNTQFAGLNARLSELHAATALESFAQLEESMASRLATVERYHAGLAAIPGIEPQVVDHGDVSTYKDFTVRVVADTFGADRDTVMAALRADGIDTRAYFFPPVHRQDAYTSVPAELPVTDLAASEVVSLPVFPMDADRVNRVVEALGAIQRHAGELSGARVA